MRAFATSSLILVALVAALALNPRTIRHGGRRPVQRRASCRPGRRAPGSAESAAIADVLAFEKATEAAVVRGDTAYLERALGADIPLHAR
jgi:hypothetical protein